jgi:hypothetical protein
LSCWICRRSAITSPEAFSLTTACNYWLNTCSVGYNKRKEAENE